MQRYWEDYVLLKDAECEKYFKKNYADKKMLFLLGAGFDERMCEGISQIAKAIEKIDVWLIRFKEAPNSDSLKYSSRVETNLQRLYSLVSKEQITENLYCKPRLYAGSDRHGSLAREREDDLLDLLV